MASRAGQGARAGATFPEPPRREVRWGSSGAHLLPAARQVLQRPHRPHLRHLARRPSPQGTTSMGRGCPQPRTSGFSPAIVALPRRWAVLSGANPSGPAAGTYRPNGPDRGTSEENPHARSSEDLPSTHSGEQTSNHRPCTGVPGKNYRGPQQASLCVSLPLTRVMRANKPKIPHAWSHDPL
jgi:hypothetical protein